MSGVDTRSDQNGNFVRHVLSGAAQEIQAELFKQRYMSNFLIQLRSGSEAQANAPMAIADAGTIAGITSDAAKIISG